MIPIGETAHVRTIRAACRRVGDAELEVTGHLIDERPHAEAEPAAGSDASWVDEGQGRIVHDMTLTIRVRHPDLVITGVDGRMDHRPYTLCADAVPPLQQLVGLSVMRGFLRAVNERFGRQLGCAHMTALVHAIAPVVKQGADAVFYDDVAMPSPDQELWFVNTCQAWREDGPLHQRVRAGDAAGLRAFSARGPRTTGA
jgi:hypothetical protein